MNTTSLHTFVVVAYKESEYLELCLESLQKQTIQSRILITTSTPSDFLAVLSQKFGVPLLINSSKSGIAADWDFAYRQAQTPYVTLAHQDDFYESGYTETLLRSASKHPDLLIAFTDYHELHGLHKKKYSLLLLVKRLLLAPFWIWPSNNQNFIKKLILSTGNPVCCPSVWYNKARIGSFTFNNTYRVNLDWEAWRRLATYKGSFVFVPKLLVCHRKHEDSESTVTIQSDIRKREDIQLLSQSWGPLIGRLIGRIYSLGYVAYKPLLTEIK